MIAIPSNQNRQDKETSRPNQIQTIFHFLKDNIATASMVADATGIYQKNICRYKRDLEKAGVLWEVAKGKCPKTGFKAWFLTCNPEFAPIQANTNIQLTINFNTERGENGNA